MWKRIEMTGKRFGKLTVLEVAGKEQNEYKWKCICDCGNVVITRGSSLRTGVTKSCGCFQKDKVSKAIKTHGQCSTRLHRIWSAMKQRCYNPHHMSFCNYGGRGIVVCDEWLHDYSAFSSWALSHGYDDSLTIDRINNDGNYEPTNCRWATMKEQNNNKRHRNYNKIIEQ